MCLKKTVLADHLFVGFPAASRADDKILVGTARGFVLPFTRSALERPAAFVGGGFLPLTAREGRRWPVADAKPATNCVDAVRGEIGFWRARARSAPTRPENVTSNVPADRMICP